MTTVRKKECFQINDSFSLKLNHTCALLLYNYQVFAQQRPRLEKYSYNDYFRKEGGVKKFLFHFDDGVVAKCREFSWIHFNSVEFIWICLKQDFSRNDGTKDQQMD